MYFHNPLLYLASYPHSGLEMDNAIFDFAEAPSDLTNFRLQEYCTDEWSKSHPSHFSKEWLPTLHLLLRLRDWRNMRQMMKKRIYHDLLVQYWLGKASTCFTLFSGILYAAARLAPLALAFTTLRKQDERLYIDTWVRFLPSIS